MFVCIGSCFVRHSGQVGSRAAGHMTDSSEIQRLRRPDNNCFIPTLLCLSTVRRRLHSALQDTTQTRWTLVSTLFLSLCLSRFSIDRCLRLMVRKLILAPPPIPGTSQDGCVYIRILGLLVSPSMLTVRTNAIDHQ